APGLVDRDVVERLLQPLTRVRPRSLRVREVVAPTDVVDADLVAHPELAALRVRRADEAVAIDILRRRHRDRAAERVGTELLRALLPEEQAIPEPHQRRQPPATGFSDAELQARIALEHSRPQHEPQRPRGPPRHLGDIDAEVITVGLTIGRA